MHGVFPYGTDAVDRTVLDFLRGVADRPSSVVVAAKPLPGDEGTFEHWSPLDLEGERSDPGFSDPTVAAPTATLTPVDG